MKYEEMYNKQIASIDAMLEKAKKTKEEACDLYALIYMRGWLKGITEELDKIIP